MAVNGARAVGKCPFCMAKMFPTRLSPTSPDFGIALADRLLALDYEGGYVVIGIILQERLTINKRESMQKAADCIIAGNKWYMCDQQYAKLYHFTPNGESYDGDYVPTGDYILKQHKQLFGFSKKHGLPHRIKCRVETRLKPPS